MSKIYQKMYPGNKNRSKSVLGGFIHKVILRSFYSESQSLSFHRAGFTLIELLVVVLIIGILAAIALPQYQKAVARSRAAEALVMLAALEQAQQLHYMANGKYTTNLSSLDIQIKDSSSFRYATVLTEDYWRNYATSDMYGVAFEFPLNSRSKWCMTRLSSTLGNAICATYGKYHHAGDTHKYYLMD